MPLKPIHTLEGYDNAKIEIAAFVDHNNVISFFVFTITSRSNEGNKENWYNSNVLPKDLLEELTNLHLLLAIPFSYDAEKNVLKLLFGSCQEKELKFDFQKYNEFFQPMYGYIKEEDK